MILCYNINVINIQCIEFLILKCEPNSFKHSLISKGGFYGKKGLYV